MSAVLHLCVPCAQRLDIEQTCLLRIFRSRCAGCGVPIGSQFGVDYFVIWDSWVWPIAWGRALQDFAGAHVHEWKWTFWSNITGERRERCRCGERRTRFEAPSEARS